MNGPAAGTLTEADLLRNLTAEEQFVIWDWGVNNTRVDFTVTKFPKAGPAPGGVQDASNILDKLSNAYIDFINDSRDITDKYSEQGLLCFPTGFLYRFWEQYTPVMGFLSWLGLKLNGVSVVNMVMAVGVSVEFTAHITRLFMVTPGSNVARAVSALSRMFFPICLGVLSTFIGILPLAFADFGYFRLYFFQQYALILIFGLLDGLVLLPILLMLLGPPPLLTAGDKLGSRRKMETSSRSGPGGPSETENHAKNEDAGQRTIRENEDSLQETSRHENAVLETAEDLHSPASQSFVSQQRSLS
eukprot:g46110.t1